MGVPDAGHVALSSIPIDIATGTPSPWSTRQHAFADAKPNALVSTPSSLVGQASTHESCRGLSTGANGGHGNGRAEIDKFTYNGLSYSLNKTTLFLAAIE